ncbi:Protein of unknown function, partial [Gryllus bimaculatus]
ATQDLLRLFPSYLTKGSKGNERERSNTSEDSCVLPKCTHPLFSWRLSNLLCLRIIRRHHLREVIVKMPFDLPDDILVEVFTYLTVEDIVLRIRHVNERWVAVAENSRVWKRLTYRPTLRYSEKEIIDFLRQAPKLQWPQPSQALVRQLAPPVLFWVLYKVIRKYKYGGDEVLIVIL